jgi:focal adhesion kinase 1
MQHQHHPNQELHKFIEARMKKQQQEESEKDSMWLREQEESIKKRLSISSINESLLLMQTEAANGTQTVVNKPPPSQPNNNAPMSPKLDQRQPSTSSAITSPQDGAIKTEPPKPIDRLNDPIYKCTTNVVRSVMTLSNGVEKSTQCEYLELVKAVGLELRNLLGTVDQISSNFPPHTHK